ncbi:hypothetical protein J1614_003144 [Plenodomus biglobosus]|nr:hypothetical protein J1614_003144 [Plenodomus biglobosus]
MYGSAKGGRGPGKNRVRVTVDWEDKLETSRLSSPPMASNEDRSDQQHDKAFRSLDSIDFATFVQHRLRRRDATELGEAVKSALWQTQHKQLSWSIAQHGRIGTRFIVTMIPQICLAIQEI